MLSLLFCAGPIGSVPRDELNEKCGSLSHPVDTDTYAWFRMSQMLRGLGRTPEARTALTHSRDEALREHQAQRTPPEGDPHWTHIKAAQQHERIK